MRLCCTTCARPDARVCTIRHHPPPQSMSWRHGTLMALPVSLFMPSRGFAHNRLCCQSGISGQSCKPPGESLTHWAVQQQICSATPSKPIALFNSRPVCSASITTIARARIQCTICLGPKVCTQQETSKPPMWVCARVCAAQSTNTCIHSMHRMPWPIGVHSALLCWLKKQASPQ